MGTDDQQLTISSRDFEPDGRIGDRFAHADGNEIPAFEIQGVPAGTVELAIICHDPDAPMPDGFTHWTLYGLPPDTARTGPDADERFRAGENDFGEVGYGGPEPPPGHGMHRYYFWVYALDTAVEGQPSRREFIESYGGHVIEQNRVVGTYER
jgi:Raf kinase inhibitor-like YbhB/YbcL family protein